MRAPRLSRPSQAKGTSRLIALTLAVAAGAIYLPPASLNCDAVDFLETGQPALHFLESRATQVPHALLGRLIPDFDRTAAAQDDACNGFGHRQHLVDPCATLVAVGAVRASLGAEDFEPG